MRALLKTADAEDSLRRKATFGGAAHGGGRGALIGGGIGALAGGVRNYFKDDASVGKGALAGGLTGAAGGGVIGAGHGAYRGRKNVSNMEDMIRSHAKKTKDRVNSDSGFFGGYELGDDYVDREVERSMEFGDDEFGALDLNPYKANLPEQSE